MDRGLQGTYIRLARLNCRFLFMSNVIIIFYGYDADKSDIRKRLQGDLENCGVVLEVSVIENRRFSPIVANHRTYATANLRM